MLDLETPPKPAATDEPTGPGVERPVPRSSLGRRAAYLEEHELIVLLDSIDDERTRARFRESIYLSLLVWVLLALFALFGPKYIFHQNELVTPGAEHKNDHELTFLNLPPDLSKLPPPKAPKTISERTTTAQTAHPVPQPKVPPAPRPNPPGPQAQRPLPATPQPQASAPPQPAQPPQPARPQPQPIRPTVTANNSIPDAPRPSTTTRPNFSTPTTSGESIRSAANAAAASRGGGGDYGSGVPRPHAGAKSGVEVLSDTRGVDFGPYLKRLHRLLENAWIPLLPEEVYPPLNKDGTTVIRIKIARNGVVSFMHLDGSTHDIAIDKAAWGSITSQGQLPPLPAEFPDEDIELRYTYTVTHTAE